MTAAGALACLAGALAAALVLASAANAPALAQTSSEEERAWNEPVEPFRVAGNVYYVGAREVAVYLIATPEGHVLIDSGFEETVPQALANVEALGFRPADVEVLLASHAHYDHVGGMATLRERTGARLHLSAGDAELAARGGQGDPNFGDRFRYRAFTPDRVLDNAGYPGIAADFRATFARLEALSADVFLAPHGSFFGLLEKRAELGMLCTCAEHP